MYRITVQPGEESYAVVAYDVVELAEILEFLEDKRIPLISVIPDPIFLEFEEFQDFIEENFKCPDCQNLTEKAKEDIQRNLDNLTE